MKPEEGSAVGAWGTGPFDNDDALDFFLDIEDAPSDRIAKRVRDALGVAADEDAYLEEPAAGEAIAAAAVVACWRSAAAGVTAPEAGTVGPGIGLDSGSGRTFGAASGLDLAGNPRVSQWLASHRASLVAADTELALRALDRVSGARSEWRELWADAGHAEEAQATVRAIHESLERAIPGSLTTPRGRPRSSTPAANVE